MTDGDGLAELVHVVDRQAIAREAFAVWRDVQVAQAGDLLDTHVADSGDALQQLRGFSAQVRQPSEIRAIDERRHVRADASDELVGSHLDRLRNGAGYLGHLGLELRGDLVPEAFFAQAGAPLSSLLEGDVHVRLLDAHRIGGQLRGAGLADDVGDFRHFEDRLLDALVHGDRFGQCHAGQASRLDQHVTFVELGHELGADAREQQRCSRERKERNRNCGPAMLHTLAEQWRIDCSSPPQQPRFMLAALWPHDVTGQHRNEGQGQQEGAEQGQQDRGRHWPEQLSLQAREREDRQVHDGDDRFAEDAGRAHLQSCLAQRLVVVPHSSTARVTDCPLQIGGAPHSRR